jgi:prepilin-type N-terminal cleavage/methylation domain-containing protein/prepilin-type processing-associated H-X9-DG protein
MSTLRRIRSRSHRDERATATQRPNARSSAFTLIELLVVVAIISLLLSILLPSLRSAREQAKAVVCGSHLKGLGSSFAIYTSEQNEWLPGINTSGVELRAISPSDIEGMQRGHLPVQHVDWMTPLIRTETNLPSRRAERFDLLLNRYKDPAHRVTSVPFNTPNAELAEFAAVPTWAPVSYLMPMAFQHWGSSHAGEVIGQVNGISSVFGQIRAEVTPDFFSVSHPSYVSQLPRVGAPAAKILAADGTRFLPDNAILDHDVEPFPNFFGSFTTSGGWFRGSQAYGVSGESSNWDGDSGGGTAPAADGQNLRLTYRHSGKSNIGGSAQGNKGSINALFFDGHVSRMQDRESRRIELWYPKGSIVDNPATGMTTVPQGYVVR